MSMPEDLIDNFKCDLCGKDYKGRANFMRHKKLLHPELVPQCKKFSLKKCSRGEKECWFEHKVSENMKIDDNPWPKLVKSSPIKTDAPVFREATENAIPPDQLSLMMKMIGNLCNKVEKMEEKLEDLMN